MYHHYITAQHADCQDSRDHWGPGWKCALLSLYLNNITSPPSLWQCVQFYSKYELCSTERTALVMPECGGLAWLGGMEEQFPSLSCRPAPDSSGMYLSTELYNCEVLVLSLTISPLCYFISSPLHYRGKYCTFYIYMTAIVTSYFANQRICSPTQVFSITLSD